MSEIKEGLDPDEVVRMLGLVHQNLTDSVVLPRALILDSRLHATEVRIYAVIAARQQERPSLEEIAADVGVTDRTAKRAVARLRETGWIETSRKRRHETNRYTINLRPTPGQE